MYVKPSTLYLKNKIKDKLKCSNTTSEWHCKLTVQGQVDLPTKLETLIYWLIQ